MLNKKEIPVKETRKLLKEKFNIDERVIDAAEAAEEKASKYFDAPDETASFNQYKILSAFQKERLSDAHFAWNTGYGYDDAGRDVTERIYADVFGCEAAIVRSLIVNGTHALTLALAGPLRPGDELIYCTGAPYDTLHEAIGLRSVGNGSLKEFGIDYKQTELLESGKIDLDALGEAITKKTRMVSIQRATGYAWRPAITLDEIARCAEFVHSIDTDIIVMADNCYGEFLETKEPTDVGVDLIAGSLIKNPGGGLALSGGYVAGKKDLIDKVASRMTSPGIGGECGLTFGQTRTILQGLFMAPTVVSGAIKGAMFCAQLFSDLGFEVSPLPGEARSDIIETIKLGSPEALIAFCRGVQAAAPIDSFVSPEPWAMPGYEADVIMAAGAFVQGSSIELSADGPLREPYNVYFQGGLTYEHSKFGAMKAMDQMLKEGVIT